MKLAWYEKDGDWSLVVTNTRAILCEMSHHGDRGWLADWPHLPVPNGGQVAGAAATAEEARTEAVRRVREVLRELSEAVTLVEVPA